MDGIHASSYGHLLGIGMYSISGDIIFATGDIPVIWCDGYTYLLQVLH